VYPVRLEADGGVVLREFRRDDAEPLGAIIGSQQVTQWLSFDQRSAAETIKMLAGVLERARYEPRDEYYLAVTEHPSDNVVGMCRLGLSGVEAAKLGFAVRADRWGEGLATRAAARMIDFGMTDLGLHRITAAIGPGNEASIAIVTKLGFAYEGHLRDHVFTNGRWRNSMLYSVLASEWAHSSATRC
jgi:RimJ/RimL family protein N-acetyltransferase